MELGLTASASKNASAGPASRIAVYGTGSIGFRHMRVLRDRCGAEVVAVPVRASRSAELRSQGFEVAESLEAAAASGARLAVIATDTKRHVSDLRHALALGMDALVEKPVAATASGLDEVGEEIKRRGRRVYVGCNLRFDAGMNLLRQRLPEIGAVHSVRIECQSYLPDWRPERDYRESYSARADEGGVMRDLIHEIDYAVWLFGRPKQVWAKLNNSGRLGIAAEDECDLWWRTPGGANVSIRLDYLSRNPRRGMIVRAENGDASWDAIARKVTVSPVGKPIERIDTPQERDDMMAEQAQAFIAAAAGAEPGCLATFEDGAFAIALCDAARQSSQSGKMEALPN